MNPLPAKRGEGGPSAARDRQDTVFVGQYLRIPESQNLITLRSERGITRKVAWIVGVLSSIDLDDESFLATHEIDDIRADGLLPNEFEIAKPSVAEREPQLRFSIGGLAAKPPLYANLLSIRTTHDVGFAPHPARATGARHPLPASQGEGRGRRCALRRKARAAEEGKSAPRSGGLGRKLRRRLLAASPRRRGRGRLCRLSGGRWRLGRGRRGRGDHRIFAIREPDVVDRMLDRMQARTRGEHPTGEDALDVAL